MRAAKEYTVKQLARDLSGKAVRGYPAQWIEGSFLIARCGDYSERVNGHAFGCWGFHWSGVLLTIDHLPTGRAVITDAFTEEHARRICEGLTKAGDFSAVIKKNGNYDYKLVDKCRSALLPLLAKKRLRKTARTKAEATA